MNKNYLIGILLVVIVAISLFYYSDTKAPVVNLDIKSFEDCEGAGYAVMESYPRQCRTPDGRLFVEVLAPSITYIKASKEKIVVDTPIPGGVVSKEFEIKGKAAGWYFEASFPVKVLDKDGNVLWIGPAQAQGDWMTAEFVPFKVTAKITSTYTGPATLVLEKDNPSGLPENDASASFPITIK